MLRFTDYDYRAMATLVFNEHYKGYRPAVQEAPNGDGNWDTQKRYAHVAPKYKPGRLLTWYYAQAFEEALRVHHALCAPEHLKPVWEECCLRILDYPPGAGSALHTDFDFMTLQLYRTPTAGFLRHGPPVTAEDDQVSRYIHFGEMAEVARFRKATPHLVQGLDVPQKAIVFFALPVRSAALIHAGEWLDERYARSRR